MNAESQPEQLRFIDTNILVYAYDRSAGRKHTAAARLIEQCWGNENGCISIQVLQEFYVTVTRKIAKPLEYQTARQLVADLAPTGTQPTFAAEAYEQGMDEQIQRTGGLWKR